MHWSSGTKRIRTTALSFLTPKSNMIYLLVHLNGSQAILPISLMQAVKSLRIVPLALSHR